MGRRHQFMLTAKWDGRSRRWSGRGLRCTTPTRRRKYHARTWHSLTSDRDGRLVPLMKNRRWPRRFEAERGHGRGFPKPFAGPSRPRGVGRARVGLLPSLQRFGKREFQGDE